MLTERARARARTDRMLDMAEAGARIGYSTEYVRKLLRREGAPLVRIGRAWRVWQSDLDEWAIERGLRQRPDVEPEVDGDD